MNKGENKLLPKDELVPERHPAIGRTRVYPAIEIIMPVIAPGMPCRRLHCAQTAILTPAGPSAETAIFR